ncbi:Nitrogen permease regulator [Lachnellula occidentalis]|uniref:Nitrogen permease regulator 3 n=1 Tax=Lachnellula occidentalis TaxID=215460 RepID=A0A8H8UHD6_9HELO|nr:Nitrogen permease regulator [Lachnellula occidentalis]
MAAQELAPLASRSLPGKQLQPKRSPTLPSESRLGYAEEQRQKMAFATLGNYAGLKAIGLVIRSKDGPRFVFHYPAHPSKKAAERELRFGTELDPEAVEEDDLENDSDDSDVEESDYSALPAMSTLNITEKMGSQKKKLDHEDQPKGDDHFDDEDGEHVVPWEHVFEFPTTDLESILTPSRAFHKKKFELSLDPLRFVTYPMHIREDGTWKKKKKTRKSKKSKKEGSDPEGSGEKPDEVKKPTDNSSEDGDDSGGMTMFNVVFILNLPKEEQDQRIHEIYEHIIKKFNKALKHAQASSNFVWKESEMILTMKEKAREERRPMSWVWSEILLQSTLAGAIRDVFLATSNNKIATLRLATTPPLELSLQIPVPPYLTSFPSPDERAMLGLLLTSANPILDEEGNEDPTHLNKHFALLLLDDETKIISEIQADNTELSAPLIECIRLCKPTLSFLQVAQTNSIEVNSLLILAQHLIYWRRAIAIPPLHAREMYIVSPNCDSRKLPEASVAWRKAFPLAPSLPSFLAALSAAPRPYKTFSPSKDHRQTYIDMLAWAIRGGWATQLRTVAWICVWPEILYEVQYQLKAEALEKAKNKSQASSQSAESTDESGNDKMAVDPNAPMTNEQAAEQARLYRLAKKADEDAKEFAAEFAKMPAPIATGHPSNNRAAHLKNMSPYIIKDPHKVSHEESLYIAALGKRWTDPKIRECWFRFSGKYFNGIEALEMIALQEGMKRKETWSILMHYQENIMVCKHW